MRMDETEVKAQKENPYLSTHAYMKYDGSMEWGNEEWFKIWKQMAGIKGYS